MKNLVPKRRFEEFKDSDPWEQRKLGDVVDVQSGKDYKHLSEGNIPVYGTGGYMLSVNKALSYNQDAIGIGRKGTIDKPYVLKAPFWTVDTLFYAIPKDNNELDFLNCIFQNVDWKKKDESTGVPSLSKSTINNVDIFVPDEKEQKSIGEYFSNLDHLITLHQRKLDKLKETKSAYLSEMFPKEGELYPKRRFAGFTDPWEQRKLGELTNIKTGSSDLQDAVDNGEYPFFVRSENVERSNRYIFDGEAILIPGEGRLGDIYHYINGKFDYHQRVYKISDFADSNTDGKFVLYYLQQNFKRHALKFTVKATVDSLRLPMLVDFEIKLPNIDEQREVGVFFSNLDNLITLHQRKLDKLQALKQAYLSEMFV